MSAELWTLLAMIVLGASAPLTHVFLVMGTAREHGLRHLRSWLSLLLPPATPVLAWLDGARWMPGLWALQVVAYAVLWSRT